MHCILCHNNQVNATNPRTQERRRLILYSKTNGMTSLKEHADVDHGLVAKV
jgi:capsule polysaccharide export protein KpsE/RkpR